MSFTIAYMCNYEMKKCSRPDIVSDREYILSCPDDLLSPLVDFLSVSAIIIPSGWMLISSLEFWSHKKDIWYNQCNFNLDRTNLIWPGLILIYSAVLKPSAQEYFLISVCLLHIRRHSYSWLKQKVKINVEFIFMHTVQNLYRIDYHVFYKKIYIYTWYTHTHTYIYIYI